MPQKIPDDFREQLSAWHDGALAGEASRFVTRRLVQDPGLRAEVARWQVVGDVLRRECLRATSPSLVDRVAAAIDLESPAKLGATAGEGMGRPAATPAARRRRMGIGWASAAAVGLAAVLLVPRNEAPVEAAERVASSRIESAPEPVRTAPTPPRVIAADNAAVVAAVRVPPLVRAPQPTPEQLAPLPAIEVDAPSRPWPRSAGTEEAFTVDYAVAPEAAAERR